MVTKVAINGFGRIGRLTLRAIIESKRKDISVVAINDLGTPDFNAHLLQNDSVHGQFPYKVKYTKTSINPGLGPIKIYSERNPEDLPWEEFCLLYTSPSPRDKRQSRMPSSA